ncbi:MAG: hypothetical protein V3V78_02140 [Candidatus Woesearchaeota archaeon]
MKEKKFNVAVLANEEELGAARKQLKDIKSAEINYLTTPKDLNENHDGVITATTLQYPQKSLDSLAMLGKEIDNPQYYTAHVLPLFLKKNTPVVYAFRDCKCLYSKFPLYALKKTGVKIALQDAGVGCNAKNVIPHFEGSYRKLNFLMRISSRNLKKILKYSESGRYSFNDPVGSLLYQLRDHIDTDSTERIKYEDIEEILKGDGK